MLELILVSRKVIMLEPNEGALLPIGSVALKLPINVTKMCAP